jgi:glucose/mannose-6-phosphate isomerase
MNLDQPQNYKKLDRENMLAHIRALPEQLDTAWRLGLSLELPALKPVSKIVVAGMGGSAIGADLLSVYVHALSSAPVTVHRGYGLPEWAKQPDVLLVLSSHSGNTEETLSAYRQARQNDVQCAVVTTGGKLADLAREDGCPLWQFEHTGQPRSAVGFSFGLLLALLSRLGFVAGQDKAVKAAARAMKTQQPGIETDRPIANNPAKQMALRLSGKVPVIFGADLLAPVARRWKGQINELAKQWAQAEEIPEADHNLLAGSEFPLALQNGVQAVFLTAEREYVRNQLRVQLTGQLLLERKINAEIFKAPGQEALAAMWTALHFGDYMAYYLALLNNVDPTPIDIMTGLKKALASA